jgi:DNA-binding LacI/PurR family transcriptional regulator
MRQAEPDLVELIAREVGVSASTVRRSLSGTEARYGATARRMQEIRLVAERLGYTPNCAARALRKGRFDCVALLSSSHRLRGYLPDVLVASIHDCLAEAGIRLTMARADDAVLVSGDRLKPLLQGIGADGLLLDYIDHVPEGLARSLSDLHLPMVWLNRDVAADAVRIDDAAGTRLVTAALAQRGRRCIAYVDFSHAPGRATEHYSARERFMGWQQASAAAGVAGPIFYAPTAAGERLATARRWLRGLDLLPDAVVGYAPEHAAIVMTAARMEGLPAPTIADLGAVGPDLDVLGAPFTCAQQPFAAMARSAVDLLLDKVGNAAGPHPAIVLPPTLVLPAI